jgi:phospholipase C
LRRHFFHSSVQSAFLPAVCVTLFFAALGCGTSMSMTAPSKAATVSVTAAPTSILAGGNSTLTVAAANATGVTLTGSDGSAYTMAVNGGTESISPKATTTYTATATGAGTPATSTTTVTVGAAITPTATISASPATISAGGQSVLTVTAANATAVAVAGSDGTSYSLAPGGGTQSVSPTATTTYTVTASGAGATTATASTTVTVVPVMLVPTVSITASATSIAAEASTTLTVAATNATTVVITGSDHTSYKLPGIGGTQMVNPSNTTTYTATAAGSGNPVSNSITITVTPNPAPTVTINANPGAVDASSSSLLTVAATNATSVTVTGGGTTYTLPTTGGTQAVSPTTTTTYTATATGPGGNVAAITIVTVNPNPAPTVTMAANPTAIVAGDSSTLTINANTGTVVLTGSDGTKMTLPANNTTEKVTPAETTTYTATATNSGGTTSATATVTVTASPTATIVLGADPATISNGHASTLTVTASNAVTLTLKGSDNSSYTVPVSGGTQTVTPSTTTTYTLTAIGASGQQATQVTTVTVVPSGTVDDVDHVVFMLQENHSFDNYFGMLNPYRVANNDTTGADGVTYTVDGIDDKLATLSNQNDAGTVFHPFKLTSTCVDDESSAWLESYGDVSRYDFLSTRAINMDGFVHTAEGFASSCQASGTCSGTFSDNTGQRAMGYYDQGFLNYYYFMASQFALSDRWFSPVSSKSIDNRIATFTGGSTQGLTADPGSNDGLPQLAIPTIFGEMSKAGASWKIYYTVTQGECTDEDDCPTTGNSRYPGTNFSALQESYTYLHDPSPAEQQNGCTAPTISSNNPVTGDSTGSFCVDPTHIAPLAQFYIDANSGTLPDFSFIEAGYGNNDEHPGSGQSVLNGQAEVAKILQGFMSSQSWKDSVFFLSYDEAGGPFDHVPPVPGHSNDFTDASLGSIPDISSISVSPDTYSPCLPSTPGMPTLHCDLTPGEPGANAGDAPALQGFGAQIGFRVPNMVISPFTRQHFVSHIPMDHTAVIRFVENRFIGQNAHLTLRDQAEPNLLNFFNFQAPPLQTPPTAPTPFSDPSGATCTPASFAPSAP